MTNQFVGKYLIHATVKAETGLHIGGSTTGLEIGGVDNPVVKDPVSGQPYIPGSSLKGKLRSLLEWRWGLVKPDQKGEYKPYDCNDFQDNPQALMLARIFGPNSNESNTRTIAGPTRLTIRDAFLKNADELEGRLGEDMYTEVKTENALDRVTSAANPRPMERVPKGAKFAVTMILDVYDMQPKTESRELIQALFTAMSMLEHSSLGGGGSRGSGQVKFEDIEVIWRSSDDYAKGNSGRPITLPGKTVDEILKAFPNQWPA